MTEFVADATPTFQLSTTPFTFATSRKVQDLLTKWNLAPDLKVVKLKPSILLNAGSIAATLPALLASPELHAALGLSSGPSLSDARDIPVDPLATTILNMGFFDVLQADNEIVTDHGLVRGCMDEQIEGITVQDKLREMLINPDSENAGVFKENEKNELIYHLLKLVCVGGAMCQAEEYFTEWKEVTKGLYKDLVSVAKDPAGSVAIKSSAFIIDKWGDNLALFPKKSIHNKLYIVVDEKSNYVNVIYKPFVNFW